MAKGEDYAPLFPFGDKVPMGSYAPLKLSEFVDFNSSDDSPESACGYPSRKNRLPVGGVIVTVFVPLLVLTG